VAAIVLLLSDPSNLHVEKFEIKVYILSRMAQINLEFQDLIPVVFEPRQRQENQNQQNKSKNLESCHEVIQHKELLI